MQKKLQGNFSLDSIKLNHPGGSVGYKLIHGDTSFVYFCDNEFEEEQREALTTFAGKADLLIWDGMFTQKELVTKKGWGHSSIEQAIDFNKDANCKRVIISHHAPHRSDKELDQISKILPDLFILSRDKLEMSM